MLSPNTILRDRYRIIHQLGHGGMGAVYQAMDENLNYKEMSPFGAFDMIGNAWEWTTSALKAYPGGASSAKSARR